MFGSGPVKVSHSHRNRGTWLGGRYVALNCSLATVSGNSEKGL